MECKYATNNAFFVDKILKTTSICYNFTSHGGTKYIYIIFIKHEQYHRSDLQREIFGMHGETLIQLARSYLWPITISLQYAYTLSVLISGYTVPLS